MFQSCECCCKLLWKQYSTNSFTNEEFQGEIQYGQWINNNCGRLECSKLSGAVSDVIKSIDERLEYYLFHVFIKRSQAASLVKRKGNLKIGQALFHFDLSENYPFVPQDEIQSGHWDHTSCTLFTAIVHFKDTKETIYHCIRLCHNKYAVTKFLDIILDEFSKSQSDLIINEWFFYSDGTAQHFRGKYPLCTMTLIQHLKYKFWHGRTRVSKIVVSLANLFLVITEKINKNSISNLYWSFNLIKGSWQKLATS